MLAMLLPVSSGHSPAITWGTRHCPPGSKSPHLTVPPKSSESASSQVGDQTVALRTEFEAHPLGGPVTQDPGSVHLHVRAWRVADAPRVLPGDPTLITLGTHPNAGRGDRAPPCVSSYWREDPPTSLQPGSLQAHTQIRLPWQPSGRWLAPGSGVPAESEQRRPWSSCHSRGTARVCWPLCSQVLRGGAAAGAGRTADPQTCRELAHCLRPCSQSPCQHSPCDTSTS